MGCGRGYRTPTGEPTDAPRQADELGEVPRSADQHQRLRVHAEVGAEGPVDRAETERSPV